MGPCIEAMLSLADLSLTENAQGTEPFTMIDNLLAPAPGDVPSIGGPSNDDASSCDTEDSESTDGAASCEDAAEAKQITPRNSNSDDEDELPLPGELGLAPLPLGPPLDEKKQPNYNKKDVPMWTVEEDLLILSLIHI